MAYACRGAGTSGEIGDGLVVRQDLPTGVETDGVVFTQAAAGDGFTCATAGLLTSSPPLDPEPPVIVEIDENDTYLVVTIDEPIETANRTVLMYYLNCTNTVNGTSHTGRHRCCQGRSGCRQSVVGR